MGRKFTSVHKLEMLDLHVELKEKPESNLIDVSIGLKWNSCSNFLKRVCGITHQTVSLLSIIKLYSDNSESC